MSNDVFANGREISCKKGDGKTICEFPDVCFTPPENPATPPGVPVPYPNTAFASDTTEGSKTVKISGEEIMLKNSSYFKTSSGDEAGAAAKKGVITSTNKGKAYFISWSMDVQIEGENAVRHLDMTTNNHASPMANGSVPQVQPDTQAVQPSGGDEKCNHEYECEPITNPKSQGKTVDEMAAARRLGKNLGDDFEARAIEHNRDQVKSGDDVSPDFRCKKCRLRREVDHITRDDNGNITKVVQCKSDQSKVDPTKKGVIVTPKQLKESRKVVKAISECQKDAGVDCKLEYKLEDGEAAQHAKNFLERSEPPIVTMVQ